MEPEIDRSYWLIQTDVDEARKLKWNAGRRQHGPVMTLDPLLELYAECLDGINYCNALMGTDAGFPESSMEATRINTIRNSMVNSARQLQEIYRSHPERQYQPQEFPFK